MGSRQHDAVLQGKHKILARVGAVACSVLLLWAVSLRLDPDRLLVVAREANPWGLLLAVLIFGCGQMFAAWRWHLMLRFGGNVVHYGASVRGAIIGHCFHTFLFGAGGGDVVKSGIYARWYGLKMSEVLAAAPLDRLLALVGAILFGVSTVLLAVASGGFRNLPGRELLLVVGWMLCVLVMVAVGVWLVSRWRGTRFAALDRFRVVLQQGGADLVGNRTVLFKAIGAAFMVHACLSFTMLTCLASVTSSDVSWFAVLWLFPVVSMIAGVPVSIGGAGLREGSSMFLFALYGIAAEDAVAASLFTLVVSFTWCFVGLLLWWRGREGGGVLRGKEPPKSISVVIPTFNESESLAETVRRVREIPEVCEVLLADGGSSDDTVDIGEALGCRVVRSARGRGTQMRAAAKEASGDVVWLLHADTYVSPGAGQALLNAFRDPMVVAGGFWKRFDQRNLWMLGSRFRCLLRLHLMGRLMGDQAMFVRRSVLEQVGGVPDVPLMEEFELCRSLRRIGRLSLADDTVITSGRKFRGLGALRTYWRMWTVTLRYYWGTPIDELARIYAKK